MSDRKVVRVMLRFLESRIPEIQNPRNSEIHPSWIWQRSSLVGRLCQLPHSSSDNKLKRLLYIDNMWVWTANHNLNYSNCGQVNLLLG